MTNQPAPEDIYIDANGNLTERISTVDGTDIAYHYQDIPECDVTTIHGMRCTTPLRTVIDLAPTTERSEWEQMVHTCIVRRLFTIDEALVRVANPDMAAYPGAMLLREFLHETGGVGRTPN